MHFLLNHPELKGDICDTLKARQHDPEETVRYEVVMAIVSVSKKDMQVVAESEELLNFVKERTLDKKFKIRKEAISGNKIYMYFKSHALSYCRSNTIWKWFKRQNSVMKRSFFFLGQSDCRI